MYGSTTLKLQKACDQFSFTLRIIKPLEIWQQRVIVSVNIVCKILKIFFFFRKGQQKKVLKTRYFNHFLRKLSGGGNVVEIICETQAILVKTGYFNHFLRKLSGGGNVVEKICEAQAILLSKMTSKTSSTRFSTLSCHPL